LTDLHFQMALLRFFNVNRRNSVFITISNCKDGIFVGFDFIYLQTISIKIYNPNQLLQINSSYNLSLTIVYK
jgi:hypothetical protein